MGVEQPALQRRRDRRGSNDGAHREQGLKQRLVPSRKSEEEHRLPADEQKPARKTLEQAERHQLVEAPRLGCDAAGNPMHKVAPTIRLRGPTRFSSQGATRNPMSFSAV